MAEKNQEKKKKDLRKPLKYEDYFSQSLNLPIIVNQTN